MISEETGKILSLHLKLIPAQDSTTIKKKNAANPWFQFPELIHYKMQMPSFQ